MIMVNELKTLNTHLSNLKVNLDQDHSAMVFLKELKSLHNEVHELELQSIELFEVANNIKSSKDFYRARFYIIITLLVLKMFRRLLV